MRTLVSLVLSLAGCPTPGRVDDSPEPHTCTSLPASDRLDFVHGCAEGLCVHEDTEADVLASLGVGDCTVDEYTNDGGYVVRTVACDYGGLVFSFNTYSEITWIYVSLPWAGSDENHLGLDIPMACFVDVFGEPSFTWSGALAMAWDDPEFSVGDNIHNATGSEGSDGLCDRITF